MQNKLIDLNNHLMAQLERLGEEGLTSEQIDQEGLRAKAMVDVSAQVIKTAEATLKAADMMYKYGVEIPQIRNQIEQKQLS